MSVIIIITVLILGISTGVISYIRTDPGEPIKRSTKLIDDEIPLHYAMNELKLVNKID